MSESPTLPQRIAEHATRVAVEGSPEWFSARSTGIGASEVAAACGKSRYETPLHIYHRKTNPDAELIDDAPNKADGPLIWGQAFESVAIQFFELTTGISIDRSLYRPPMLRSKKYPHLIATPDAFTLTGETLDAKTCVSYTSDGWGDSGTDEIPTEVLLQVQTQLAVTGLESGWIVLLIIDQRETRTYPIPRNQKLIDIIAQMTGDLWYRIERGLPPEPTWEHPASIALVKSMYDRIGDGIVSLSEQSRKHWTRYEAMGKKIKALDTLRDARKAAVLYEIGEQYAGDLGDGRMLRRKQIEKKAYTVAATSYIDARAVTLDPHLQSVTSLSQRYADVDYYLANAGYKLKEESPSGSRYYVALGKSDVRVSDHPANGATRAWMQKHDVTNIDVLTDDYMPQLARLLNLDSPEESISADDECDGIEREDVTDTHEDDTFAEAQDDLGVASRTSTA